ncbi:helix-turn-helix domain-containing protein [Nocardia niwae]|uniref:helix-turn-helix domain-containing protein n=1 Tax=Nocardia niwae TaxID=626084 RepID=UPI0007A5299E|nr:helix-turn-helix transcriptional regulator [Nocardia niwae]
MDTSAADPGNRDDDMDEAARQLDLALGKAIVVLRATRDKMTQDELAELSGISKKTIGRIETGQSSMRMPQMLRISTALGVELGDLLKKAQELGG